MTEDPATPSSVRHLLELADDPLWAVDGEGHLAVVNEAFCALVGATRDALVGSPFRELVHPDDVGEFRRRIDVLAAEETGAEETWHGRLVTDSGLVIPVAIAFVVLTGSDGSARVAGRVRDERELRSTEAKLNILNRALRHNIRNKMNVVLGHARTLQAAEDEGFRLAAERIEATVEDVIAISEKARKAHEHTDIPPDEACRVDLAARVPEMRTTLEIAYHDAAISITVPDAAPARAPPAIDVAITELVENAVRHHSSGSGPVDIAVETGADTVTVHVRDRCEPVPASVRDALARGVESPLEHSEGLGLWIVTWLVEPVGGELVFERREDGDGNDVALRFEALEEVA